MTGPRRSPSGTIIALGSSAQEVNALARAVATSAAIVLAKHPDSIDLAEAIATGAAEAMADAVLKVREQGKAAAGEESRTAFTAVAARLEEAIQLLEAPVPDTLAARRAIVRALAALPTRAW